MTPPALVALTQSENQTGCEPMSSFSEFCRLFLEALYDHINVQEEPWGS
jgi:hypothetical protein